MVCVDRRVTTETRGFGVIGTNDEKTEEKVVILDVFTFLPKKKR